MGTIVPIMSTKSASILASTLFGKTRRAVLSLLYSHPDEAFYLRQIARTVDLGQGTVQRELAQLLEAGLLTQRRQGNQLHFQANAASPIYQELRSIVTKTAGAGDALRLSLAGLSAQIEVAFIYGSVAKGAENNLSDIDVMVVGDVSFRDVVKALRSAEVALGREINPSVYPSREYRSKLKSGHHFLNSLLKAPKIFLIGGPSELKRMGPKGLASSA
jgi:DNA-binding transcriptional ArsR family regulator